MIASQDVVDFIQRNQRLYLLKMKILQEMGMNYRNFIKFIDKVLI